MIGVSLYRTVATRDLSHQKTMAESFHLNRCVTSLTLQHFNQTPSHMLILGYIYLFRRKFKLSPVLRSEGSDPL